MALKNLKKILLNIDAVIAGIALAALVLLTIIGALSRYFLDYPFTWLEEVQIWCEVWVVFIGAGAAFRSGSHVAIEMIIDALPKPVQKIFDFIIAAVVIGVIGYLLVQSIGFIQLFVNSGRTTSILQIPYSLIYGIVPISCILMIVNYLYIFIKRVQGSGMNKEVQINE